MPLTADHYDTQSCQCINTSLMQRDSQALDITRLYPMSLLSQRGSKCNSGCCLKRS